MNLMTTVIILKNPPHDRINIGMPIYSWKVLKGMWGKHVLSTLTTWWVEEPPT